MEKDYYQQLDGQPSIIELLAMPELAEFEFEPEKLKDLLFKPADL